MTEKIWHPTEPQKDSAEAAADYAEIYLRELYDMGSRWGNRLRTKPHIAILDPNTLEVSSDLRITTNTNENDHRMIIKREGNDVLTWMPFSEKSEFAFFFLPPGREERKSSLGIPYIVNKPQILVAYDTSIPLSESFDLFIKLGKTGVATGLIDEGLAIKDNPKRQSIESSKYETARFFEKAGSKIAILPGDDISEILTEFDQPDELEVINDPDTNEPAFISHKRWHDYHVRHFQVVQETMEQHGLNRLNLLQLTSQDPRTFGPLLLSVMKEAEDTFSKDWTGEM